MKTMVEQEFMNALSGCKNPGLKPIDEVIEVPISLGILKSGTLTIEQLYKGQQR